MAYRRSRARKRFEADTGQILLSLRESFSSKCSSRRARELAMCSAILLSSAKVESYTEDLIGDWGNSVRTSTLTTDKIPTRMRAFLLNHPDLLMAHRKYVYNQDERELLSQLEMFVGAPLYQLGVDGQSIPPFTIESVYKDRKFPSLRNLKRLFDRFGFANIFRELNTLAQTDVEASLTSFNDLRNEMAHVGLPVGLTHGDVRERVLAIRRLVGYLDRVFYSHFCRSLGHACWIV